MKVRELKLMNEQDLENKLVELRKELMKINSQIAIGTLPKSPGKVKEFKRTIAKIITLQQTSQRDQSGISKKEEQKRNE